MSESKVSSKPVVPPLELISDSSDSSDGDTVNGNENHNQANQGENVAIQNHDRDISPESGIDLDSRGTTGITENEIAMVSESTERTVIPPNQLFNFDLTNPEEVLKMLETVNLSDEDTDVLLQEAYNVNMKLKEILRRQEQSGGTLNSRDAAALKGSNVVVVSGPNKGSLSNSRTNSASKRSQFTKAAPLPPISNSSTLSSNMRIPSAVYSAKLTRPMPPSSAAQTSHQRPALSSQDRRAVSRNPSASTMHKRSRSTQKSVPVSTEERPAWNDRFMY